jgi:Holliday junction resolvase
MLPVSISEEPDLPRPLKLPTFKPNQNAHEILKAIEACGYKLDDVPSFIKQVQHFDYGLAAETEFATLLAWLGRCELVHQLDQRIWSSQKQIKWTIPDLFAVFRNGSDQFSAMIEVKTTSDGRIRDFKSEYIERLRHYSALHSQPLLIAWRPRALGIWFLVPADCLKPEGDVLKLDLENAWKNNLMGCVAGDFSVHRYGGCGIYVVMHRKSEMHPIADGYSAEFVIEKVEWRDRTGNPYQKLPLSISSALMTKGESCKSDEDPYHTEAFICDNSFVLAQEILRTYVTFWSEHNDLVRWNHVYDNFDAILSRDKLHADLQSYFGIFIKYLLHQLPSTWPSFLPESWRESVCK